MFSTATLGNAEACRTECEISDDSGNCVAVVYESTWRCWQESLQSE
jgi:hypothetical protein